jgi:hypothetical protein
LARRALFFQNLRIMIYSPIKSQQWNMWKYRLSEAKGGYNKEIPAEPTIGQVFYEAHAISGNAQLFRRP